LIILGPVCTSYSPTRRVAAVKAEVQDADELALCVVIPAPPSPGDDHQVDNSTIHDDLAEGDIPASVRRYKGYVSRRRPVTGAERQRAMELAYAFRSSLPYCVMRMSTMHVYYSFMMVRMRPLASSPYRQRSASV
jgi:hypothetical protein